jgi:hypothetical protein
LVLDVKRQKTWDLASCGTARRTGQLVGNHVTSTTVDKITTCGPHDRVNACSQEIKMSHDEADDPAPKLPDLYHWDRLCKASHGLLCYVCQEKISAVSDEELCANIAELMVALDNLLASRRK